MVESGVPAQDYITRFVSQSVVLAMFCEGEPREHFMLCLEYYLLYPFHSFILSSFLMTLLVIQMIVIPLDGKEAENKTLVT